MVLINKGADRGFTKDTLKYSFHYGLILFYGYSLIFPIPSVKREVPWQSPGGDLKEIQEILISPATWQVPRKDFNEGPAGNPAFRRITLQAGGGQVVKYIKKESLARSRALRGRTIGSSFLGLEALLAFLRRTPGGLS